MNVEITDAYAHCGLRKYKPVEDLRNMMDATGVRRAVLVQHRGEYDHHYIEDIVRANPDRFAGVFLVDHDSAKGVDDVTRWAQRGSLRGIRLAAETLATQRTLWVWAAQLGLHFVVDGEVVERAADLEQFARQHPRTTIIFTHLMHPLVKESPDFGTHRRLLALAQRPNVMVQVSGMHLFSKPPYAELAPWVETLYKRFGPKRLMYASNFPVMKTDAVYRLELELVSGGKFGIPPEALAAVMNDNAVRVWFSPRSRQPRR